MRQQIAKLSAVLVKVAMLLPLTLGFFLWVLACWLDDKAEFPE